MKKLLIIGGIIMVILLLSIILKPSARDAAKDGFDAGLNGSEQSR